MRALEARDMLHLWESCATLHPIDRALSMLRVGAPEESYDALAALPIGERERLAVALRVRTFGLAAEGASECPACGLAHEVDPPLEAILSTPRARTEPLDLEARGYQLVVRAPDSYDQAAITRCDDEASGLRTLLARCVSSASRDGESVEAGTLPEEVISAIAEVLSSVDSNAETLIDLTCSRCDHQWTLVFDAGEFLWREVAARARRLLYEVHVLARGYGWSEADVLAMSARRREAYLNQVGA